MIFPLACGEIAFQILNWNCGHCISLHLPMLKIRLYSSRWDFQHPFLWGCRFVHHISLGKQVPQMIPGDASIDFSTMDPHIGIFFLMRPLTMATKERSNFSTKWFLTLLQLHPNKMLRRAGLIKMTVANRARCREKTVQISKLRLQYWAVNSSIELYWAECIFSLDQVEIKT